MPKKKRVTVPKELADEVMFIHNNTCCVCRDPNKETQIHHIDEDPSNNDINNLAVLCLECHNKTQITGGFGRRLNAGQITKYRKQWIEIVRERNKNLALGAFPIEKPVNNCWEKIDFTNQCGIENAIAGLGLNQNNVISCPRLPIFEVAYKNVDTLHFVNIIGESGSGKSLTAFQIAYEFFKKGYTVYSYIGGEAESLGDCSPSLYIIDNAHLCQSIAESIKKRVNNDIKLICVYTDSANVKESGIRITAKQAVDVLYEYYKMNANLIIPIAKKFNRNLGVEFGDISYINLLARARMQNNPYYFNYIIRGAADYVKDKISDYKSEGFSGILTIIAIYQILNADDYITEEKICELLDTKLIPDDFEKKLIFNDKMLVKNQIGYKFSHVHTAINYLNYYILNSFDNQNFANKIFWSFFDSNAYSLQGLLWHINNISHHVFKYKTNRQNLGLFTTSEIETIYDRLHERKNEPFFLGIIERIKYLLKNRNINDRIDEYIQVINSCQIIDLPCVGDFINMLINMGKDDNYCCLKKVQGNINYSRILKLFNDSPSEHLIYFVRFFDRLAYNFKGWNKQITKHLDTAAFVLKINNIPIDSLYSAVDLAATFCFRDKSLKSIRDACVNRILYYLKQNPIETWQHIDDHAFYALFGFDKFSDQIVWKSEYYKMIRAQFAKAIDPYILANQIESNNIYHWQTIATLIETIYRFDKSKYAQIINKIDLTKLSCTLKGLWGTGQEFEYLRIFYYDVKAGAKLIALCEADIEKITTSILFFSTKGAIYLHKKGKPFDFEYARNEYVLIVGLFNLVKKDRDLGVRLVVENKAELIKFIKGTNYDYDDSDIKLKESLHKSLIAIKEELCCYSLSPEELSILLDFENYNLTKKHYT